MKFYCKNDSCANEGIIITISEEMYDPNNIAEIFCDKCQRKVVIIKNTNVKVNYK